MVQPTCFADEVLEEHKIDSESADDLLRDITLANRKPNYAETVFFQQKMGWDDIRVRDQLRRMHGVLRNQAIAGTPADRQAATTESETAGTIAEKELPKIDKKLADLQSQRDAIQRDARLSARRCEEQAQAVLQLRTMCPQHIQQRVESKVSTIANTLRRDVIDAESRIHELQCCTTPAKYADENSYLEALKRSFRDAVTVIDADRIRVIKLSPAWPGIRIAIEAELAELQSKLPGLQALYDDAIEAAEMPLNYYTSNQPES